MSNEIRPAYIAGAWSDIELAVPAALAMVYRAHFLPIQSGLFRWVMAAWRSPSGFVPSDRFSAARARFNIRSL